MGHRCAFPAHAPALALLGAGALLKPEVAMRTLKIVVGCLIFVFQVLGAVLELISVFHV